MHCKGLTKDSFTYAHSSTIYLPAILVWRLAVLVRRISAALCCVKHQDCSFHLWVQIRFSDSAHFNEKFSNFDCCDQHHSRNILEEMNKRLKFEKNLWISVKERKRTRSNSIVTHYENGKGRRLETSLNFINVQVSLIWQSYMLQLDNWKW